MSRDAAVEKPDDIVGHKTLRDERGAYHHEPLTRAEGDALWARCEAEREKRAADMPDDKAAINAMWSAHYRLTELGWRDAIYCPKDGTHFQVIEAGSTGTHDCFYDGKWPNGHWWICDDHDMYPSRPVLFRLYPEDQARETAARAKLVEK